MSIPQSLKLLLVLLLTFQLTACGYFLYPERKNQAKGRLDPAIVALDTIGLLFFILPGVVAFAVDFSTGTIYLPPENAKNSNDTYKTISFDIASSNYNAIEKIISNELHVPIELNNPNMEKISLENTDNLALYFNNFLNKEEIAFIK